MSRMVFFVLAALACQAYAGPVDELYQSVIVGDFNTAVSQSKSFGGHVVARVVEKLIGKGERNVLDYGHALWNGDAQDYVKTHFPMEIRSIVGRHRVKLIGKRDNMVVKLGAGLDSDRDRIAFGDSNHMIGDRMAWEFIPVQDSQLFFKLYNPVTNQYLKTGKAADEDGDHRVYGANESGSYVHHWYLLPVKYDDQLLFYIFNREFHQGLKMSRALDSYNDRTLYTEHGPVIGEPLSFGWIIAPM